MPLSASRDTVFAQYLFQQSRRMNTLVLVLLSGRQGWRDELCLYSPCCHRRANRWQPMQLWCAWAGSQMPMSVRRPCIFVLPFFSATPEGHFGWKSGAPAGRRSPCEHTMEYDRLTFHTALPGQYLEWRAGEGSSPHAGQLRARDAVSSRRQKGQVYQPTGKTKTYSFGLGCGAPHVFQVLLLLLLFVFLCRFHPSSSQCQAQCAGRHDLKITNPSHCLLLRISYLLRSLCGV